MTSRKTTIPPLLEPYLRLPPEASLLLLTGVLNATPHWLTTRVLRGAYGDAAAITRNIRTATQEEDTARTDGGHEDVAVVLVSWLRDWEFWKGEARRGAGLDLARLAHENKFAFVDGLTGIFSSALPSPAASAPPNNTQQRATPASPQRPLSASIGGGINPAPGRTLPIRSAGVLPQRGPAPAPARPAPQQAQPAQSTPPQSQPQKTTTTPARNLYTLTSPALKHAQETITSAIRSLASAATNKRIVLILDSPTTPLALSPSAPNSINSTALGNLVLALRDLVHTTVISLETDLPFLGPATLALQQSQHQQHQQEQLKTPLETEMSRFIVGQAHAARWVVGVRGLDTGVARDVSGVVRVTRGGAWDDDDDNDDDGNNGNANGNAGENGSSNPSTAEREIEVLYFVQPDGGVRVFERGGGEIG